MPQNYDVLVIGAGPGGYPTAIRAAQLGLRVAIVEREKVGGVCLNWGCVPTKALLASAKLLRTVRHLDDFGLRVTGASANYGAVVERSRAVADRFGRGVTGLLKKYGVELIRGTVSRVGEGEVEIDRDGTIHTVGAREIVIATGARARTFPNIEPDGDRILTYREAIVDPRPPGEVTILGSGAIGIEFAYFYNAMGARVTVVEGLPEILPREDAEMAGLLRKELTQQGIRFELGRFVDRVERQGDGVRTVLQDGTLLDADRCLIALGIAPNTESLGLERLGLELERGFIPIDPYGRTTVPHVYAVGDVTTRGGLAHTATAQGHTLAELLAGHPPPAVRYDAIPSCTYCDPQLASVGLTEEAARKQGYDVVVGRFPFIANAKSYGAGHPEGLVKVVLDARHGEILGAHILGAEATEMIATFTLARTAELTTDEILHTVHAHPTASEAMYEAVAQALGRTVHL